MKKIIPWIIFITVIILSVAGYSSNDYARITDMEYKARVVDEPNSSGKIVVTERITFDIHAASQSNGFWELWRDLCEDYVDGLKVHYNVLSVKQILPNGKEVVWPESPKLYWDDFDYVPENKRLGPGKWFHSPGPYDEYLEQYEAVFFYINDVYREKMTFEIEYEMYNAVLRYGDCSDLYISMFSGADVEYLESIKVDIMIPDKDMPRVGNYKASTFGTNSDTFAFTESKQKYPGYHTFSFELGEEELQFRPYNQYIEFDLISYGEDKHKFADHAAKNMYYYDDVLEEALNEQTYYENVSEIFAGIKVIVFALCIFLSIRTVKKGKKKLNLWDLKLSFNSSGEEYESFRDIPSDLDPKFAAALVFSKEKKPEDEDGVYASILLSLARKKYIDLQEVSPGEVLIAINELEPAEPIPEVVEETPMFTDGESFFPMHPPQSPILIDPREPLTLSEEYYLNLIKRHATNGYISMKAFQNRISMDEIYINDFVDKMKKSIVDNGVGLGYFQKSNYMEPRKKLKAEGNKNNFLGFLFLILNCIASTTRLDFAFGGILILAIAHFYTGHYIKSRAHKYVLLTPFGEQEYNKWRGLYNFLKSDTLINERTVIELPLWERYLVYATAFGISEKVIEAINIRCPEVVASASIVHNSYCRSTRIHHSSHRIRSSIHRSYHSYHSSGGGSFGYGSGGGRGGGSGGGGH